MVEKRLFVGNLPLGIGKTDVKKKFSNYVNVLDVEVKHRKDDTDNITSTFAFINISADAADLSNCINEMSHQDWNGHKIKVEYAKESILSRLEKERNQVQDGEQPSTTNNLKRKNDSYSGTEYKLPRVSSSSDNSMFTTEKQEKINEHAKYNGRLKMFGGTESSHASQKQEDRKENFESKHYNGDILQRFEAFNDVWKDSSESHGNTVNSRRFHSSRDESDDDKGYIHNRSQSKSSNYSYEISKNEIKNRGIVKPYNSSDSDTVNDNRNASMHGIGNKHYNGDIFNRSNTYNNEWKGESKFRGDTVNNRRFHSNRGENDDGEYYSHNRRHPESSNYGFEICKNEIKNAGIVKPYISSDSDSEGDNETSTMKLVSNKGTNKFKMDNVNYNSTVSMRRIGDTNTPLKKEDRRSSGNVKVRETKQNINRDIENNAVDTEADQSVSSESKRTNPLSQVSEEKRQKSVAEKMKARNMQNKLIKQALLQVDSNKRLNKKIIFSDDDDEDVGGGPYGNKSFAIKKTPVSAASKKNNVEKTLFDDDGSDSDINEELNKLKINQQFEGAKGQKLLELQSRYAHDNRFVLDSRFYESDNENSDDQEDNKNKSNVTGESAVGKEEVQKQMEILEDVLGYQITKAPSNKKKIQKDTALLRFDPTRSEHSKYVIAPSAEPSTSTAAETKPKQKKLEDVVDVPQRPTTEVSKEKFYEIDESLKETLKNSSKRKSGFSVLELFGSKPNEGENANDRAHYTAEASTDKNSKADYATDLPFKTKYQPRNPFKYDSSDSDEEDEEKVMQDNKQSSENNKPFFGLWSETFFVQDKDTRFKEAKEFFMNYNSDDEKETDFTKRRRYLKKIIRWKSKNSTKNDKLFKSKLGGQSTKVKRKNVTWKVRKFQKKR